MKTCKILSTHTFAGLELAIEAFVCQDHFDPEQQFSMHISQDEEFYYACILYEEEEDPSEREDEDSDDECGNCNESSKEFLLTREQLDEAINLYLKFVKVTKNK